MSMFESFSEKANLVMHATGSLHSFNTVSFEKFLLDIETYDRMRYYFSELAVDEDALAFDALKEAVEEDETFITADHTFEHCRTEPWNSQVSLHGTSKREPNGELYASIQQRMKEMLDGYQVPALAPEKRSGLDQIMRRLGMKEEDIART